jgi:alkaline phosphatase/alkaline phosphatase D
MFLEAVPVVGPKDPNPVTYRTHRINKLLQIWLVEGRDYRSNNSDADGPGKTIWGTVQKNWLKKTLEQSDATFKILISPTPMVGPDRNTKIDNHTNLDGFRYEGDAFFSWLESEGFLDKNFYIICGDRHWQYHSIHPTGFEEFSTGAMVDENAILGNPAGDPNSTDPEGKVKQLYCQCKGFAMPASGGFLNLTINPPEDTINASAEFIFYDEYGIQLYKAVKHAKGDSSIRVSTGSIQGRATKICFEGHLSESVQSLHSNHINRYRYLEKNTRCINH